MNGLAYQHGAHDANYEERRGSGYSPSRYTNRNARLDYINGYLSVNDRHVQAQSDKRRLVADAQPVVDRPLNYEEDGNVLFHAEPVRRRAR